MNFKKFTIIAAIIILIIGLSAGVYYHFKDGTPVEIQTESQSTLPMAEAPDVTISQEHVTTEYVATVEDVPVAVEPVVEVPAEPVVEANWWDSKPGFDGESVQTYETLFDNSDVTAIKNSAYGDGNYNLFDINTGTEILNHHEYGAADLNLDRELQPAQYKELVAEYGSPMHVTMETIDDDPARAGMDHVAVKYVGSKGVWEFKDNFHQGAILRSYISANIMK